MSCPHGNHEESCDICAEIDAAYESGERNGIKQERERCVALWKLLDHIDTLDDAIKQNDTEFRKAVYATQRKRFAIMSGEEFDAIRSEEQ